MSNFVILQDGSCSDRHPSGVSSLIGPRLIDFSHLTPERTGLWNPRGRANRIGEPCDRQDSEVLGAERTSGRWRVLMPHTPHRVRNEKSAADLEIGRAHV